MFEIGNWTKENHDELVKIITNQKGIAAFDFDNTLTKNDFGESVMNYLIAEGLPFLKENFFDFFQDSKLAKEIFSTRQTENQKFHSFILDEYERIQREFSVEESYRWSSFIFSGASEIEMRDISRKVWQIELSKQDANSIKPFAEMKSLIQFLIKQNWDIYIITASPEIIIQEVAVEFSIPEQNVIGMRLEKKENHFSSKIIEPYTYGVGKVHALKERFNLVPDIAFGDSENDFPLLDSAKIKGIALDKGNLEFIKKCIDKNFLIQKHFA